MPCVRPPRAASRAGGSLRLMDDLAADDCERSAAGERAARERRVAAFREEPCGVHGPARGDVQHDDVGDRKSTRLNSSHGYISYAVFCLKKKTKNNQTK